MTTQASITAAHAIGMTQPLFQLVSSITGSLNHARYPHESHKNTPPHPFITHSARLLVDNECIDVKAVVLSLLKENHNYCLIIFWNYILSELQWIIFQKHQANLWALHQSNQFTSHVEYYTTCESSFCSSK